MAEAAALDWPGLLRLGLHGLGLRPEEFWRLTPHELRLMAGVEASAQPMGRAGLDALLARYPDGPAPGDPEAQENKEGQP
ncbi:hypothetical protein PSA7680_00819 [Pseudoruegeria aquimaris]|uniref:Phage tail assembly chaperone n=1 Tax=Pseudoruegeria aquimaris TaxID=393663 RepID=A0A1Y5RP39_9RHOB|nr:rcc01693 family protein [Pseudoruegeria aquimaris]SLN21717.1 hypothetical protein PSA7680_00819 [Pseudoruegeria aquimaris]